MFKFNGLTLAFALTTAVVTPAIIVPAAAEAATQGAIEQHSQEALAKLYADNPTAKAIGAKAKAILVFPSIVKAGLGVGGSFGEGELLEHGAVVRNYNSVSATIGPQAGAQDFGYVVFLMTDHAVKYLHESAGWEIGVGPTVVVVDAGVARNLSTSTLKDDAYAFIFDQKGLMAGVALEGTKITKVNKKE
ncbi:MAG TPA: YSC84-related protein [Asticcacaulis sp.]|nr:YSC84-related protein [Asticcacaulis sp.]